MEAITHHDLAAAPFAGQRTYPGGISLWKKFMGYAERQQSRRLWWVAVGILGHGTIFTIATLAAVTLLGNIFALYAIACCAMVMVVVVNLADLPTKYTVPVFFLSLLVDIGVIITAIFLR